MSAQALSGVFTALVTPFTEDGAKVDWASLEQLIERQLEAKVEGLIPSGTTGEAPTLTEAEQLEVIRFTVERVRKRALVFAGTGTNSTAETIELSRQALLDGADGVMLVTPYYNKPTQAGLVRHVELIGRAVLGPIMLYNIPHRTAVPLEVETTLRMLQVCPQVVAIKDATGTLHYCQELLPLLPEKVALLCGDDPLTVPMMSVGARGVVSVASNLYPAEVRAVVRAMEEGDVRGAARLHARLLPVYRALFAEANPSPLKAAMAARGWMLPTVRPPLIDASRSCAEKLVTVTRNFEGT
jgi:4-hydroxy-tetrahydrodipicolinate synthase